MSNNGVWDAYTDVYVFMILGTLSNVAIFLSVRYFSGRYPIIMPKGCHMDLLGRELGKYLRAAYPASITDNKFHIV